MKQEYPSKKWMVATLSKLMDAAKTNDEQHQNFEARFRQIDRRFDHLEATMQAGFENIIGKIDAFIGLHKKVDVEQVA